MSSINSRLLVVQYRKSLAKSVAMDLGHVKTLRERRGFGDLDDKAQIFCGSGYARIAAMSG